MTDATDAATANFVYLRSADHAWIPAKVVEQADDSDQVIVKIPIYKNEKLIVSDGGKSAQRFKKAAVSLQNYSNHALPLQNVDENGKLVVVEDMVDLAVLHEVGFREHLNEYQKVKLCCHDIFLTSFPPLARGNILFVHVIKRLPFCTT